MSQTWADDVFAAGHVGQTDLQNMEHNFAALKSLFSGAAQPASMAACHPWFDTTKHVLKVRDDGDSAWLGLMHGDTSQKLWVYRNAAMSGWAIDSGVSDKVLALKGGSTYTTGAATAGTWAQPDHTLTEAELPAHDHGGVTGADGAHGHTFYGYNPDGDAGTSYLAGGLFTRGAHNVTALSSVVAVGTHTHTVSSTGSGDAHNHGTAYRPAAAVGTLQYMDL